MTRLDRHYAGVLPLLAVALVLVTLASIRWGAVPISLAEIGAALGRGVRDPASRTLNERIFLEIRLPRALLTAVAMMASGWEGSQDRNAPGFPAGWVVRWEGLRRML